MHKRLFVLAERTGQRLQNTRGVDVALCEFFMVEAYGHRFVCLFFSQLDAELMRIGENAHGNRYELIESSAAELRFFMRELKDLHCALILGFAGREDGRLYRNPAGRWSTCPMPLLPGDEAWLFRGEAKPEPDIVTDAERIYPKAGLGSYLSELRRINELKEEQLRVAAQEALHRADIAERGTGSRLMVYSIAGKSWRAGRPSV